MKSRFRYVNVSVTVQILIQTIPLPQFRAWMAGYSVNLPPPLPLFVFFSLELTQFSSFLSFPLFFYLLPSFSSFFSPLFLSLLFYSSHVGIPFIFFPWRKQPLSGKGLLIIETSRSHSNTTHSAELLWMSDQPDAETSTYTTHNTYNRQTSMPPAGFEPTIPASERPQTHALDRAAVRIVILLW
jgi:hypothetical protein